MKSAHRMRNSNKLIKWTTTWCAKHQEQPLSSTCSILGLILKCTQIFEEETTHLIKQDSIPFHHWYQHHYYQLCHDCLNFGQRRRLFFLILNWKFWMEKFLILWCNVDLKLVIRRMKQQKEMRGKSNNLPLWRTAVKTSNEISELA